MNWFRGCILLLAAGLSFSAWSQSYASGSLNQLKLTGISGSPGHPLAIVNNHTFAPGETGGVSLAGHEAQIKCLQIGSDFAIVQLQGQPGSYKITLSGEVISLNPVQRTPSSPPAPSGQTPSLYSSLLQPGSNTFSASIDAMRQQAAQLELMAQRQMAEAQKELQRQIWLARIRAVIAILILCAVVYRVWRWLKNTERNLQTIANASHKKSEPAPPSAPPAPASPSSGPASNAEHPDARYMPKQ